MSADGPGPALPWARLAPPEVAAVLPPLPDGAGAVGLLSSDEFLPSAEPFDRALLAAAGPKVALVLAADPGAAPQSARLGLAHYRRLGARPQVVDVLERSRATADALPPFDVLFLAGGSPAALLACLAGTSLWDEALRRWRGGAALAGSSAGAMALCRWCLVPEPGARRPTRWASGLGPLEGLALAVHARTAPASWLAAVAESAPVPLLALDDGVGVLLRPGRPPVVAGEGRSWIAGPGQPGA
jgi:hypothetical protein